MKIQKYRIFSKIVLKYMSLKVYSTLSIFKCMLIIGSTFVEILHVNFL